MIESMVASVTPSKSFEAIPINVTPSNLSSSSTSDVTPEVMERVTQNFLQVLQLGESTRKQGSLSREPQQK